MQTGKDVEDDDEEKEEEGERREAGKKEGENADVEEAKIEG